MNRPESSTYCKLSHVTLAIQNEGDMCVCNKNNQSFEDGARNKLYLHEVGLRRMWTSPTRRLITTGLDYNKKLPSCNACWNDEDAGVISTRQIFNKKLVNTNPSKDQPKILIIKPTNTCNLGCRTCQPATSTGLYQDFYKLETQLNQYTGTFKDYTKQFETIRDGLGKHNTEVWDTFEEWLPGLEFLDIYGGEPMLAPAMWDRFITAANQELTNNTTIQFHTNGTIWNQEYVDILPKFKSVSINISIDASKDCHLTYIRYGTDVNTLKENIKKYVDLTKQYSYITACICLTISSYNIWYLDEIIRELEQYGLEVTKNVVYGPEQYDMRHLPLPIKAQLIEKFKNSDMNMIVKILEHVIPGSDIYWPRFWQEVEALDRIRDEKFADVFPEYYQALIPYLPK